MLKLKDYQSRAVYGTEEQDGLAPTITRLLKKHAPDRKIAFTAPTGSGKTVMLATALHTAAQEAAVLWLTPGKGGLAEQSFSSLRKYLAASPLSIERLTEEWLGSNPMLLPGTIVVANWESLTQKNLSTGKRKNVLTKDSETRNLFDVLRSTSDYGVPLILVVDESHWGLDAKGVTSLLSEVSAILPVLLLQATATPKDTLTLAGMSSRTHVSVCVDIENVISDEMVCTEIVVNDSIQKHLSNLPVEDQLSITGEHLVLEGAWEKITQLRQRYLSLDSPVKPLLLVQLPDGEIGESKKNSIMEFFSSLSDPVTVANGKLATYLHDNKTEGLESVRNSTSPIQVLLFKTGIAVGWDCPRAQVLVAFREMSSTIFSVQTVGRILRTPEQKYYNDPMLNAAYVYANIDAPEGPYPKNASRPKKADIPLYTAVPTFSLPASHATRVSSRGRISVDDFFDEFSKATVLVGLDRALPYTAPVSQQQLVTDVVFTMPDITDYDSSLTPLSNYETRSAVVAIADHDAQKQFSSMVQSCLGRYARTSLKSACAAIYGWVESVRPSWSEENSDLVLSTHHAAREHSALFEAAITQTVATYQDTKEMPRLQKSIVPVTWKFGSTLAASSETDLPLPANEGYAYEDFYGCPWAPSLSSPELAVSEFLRELYQKSRILWWWKNGERVPGKYMSLGYINSENLPDTHYPDYIVELTPKSGARRLALLEVKSSGDADLDTARKAKELKKYLSSYPLSGVVLSGIVAPLPAGISINQGSPYTNPTPSSLSNQNSGWQLLSAAMEELDS